jgi:hypothetical protein
MTLPPPKESSFGAILANDLGAALAEFVADYLPFDVPVLGIEITLNEPIVAHIVAPADAGARVPVRLWPHALVAALGAFCDGALAELNLEDQHLVAVGVREGHLELRALLDPEAGIFRLVAGVPGAEDTVELSRLTAELAES